MFEWILYVIASFLVVATVAPLSPVGWKWIRIFDFPRLQLGVLITMSIAAVVIVRPNPFTFQGLLLLILAVCLAIQAYQIFPYSALAPLQARGESANSCAAGIRLMTANVRMENRNSESLLDTIRSASPDLVFLVETDAWWATALEPLERDFPHSVIRPQDNYYGMILYSRLPLISHEVLFLTDDKVPSIHAEVELQAGPRIVVRGIHPVPPPLADTYRRDAEILLVAKLVAESDLPNVVIGDLNDVGWSHTTRLFQRISGLVDPRIGRGLYASYHSKYRLMRWPLDHIFHDPLFAVRDLNLLADIGSDHFPVFAELCLQPDFEDASRRPNPDRGDRLEAQEKIEQGLASTVGPGEYPPDSGDG